MDEPEISKEERDLLIQYQSLSKSMPSFSKRLAIEIVPPVIFVAAWSYTNNAIYLIVLILVMVFYNIQRVVRQYKNIASLKSISVKTIGEIPGEK